MSRVATIIGSAAAPIRRMQTKRDPDAISVLEHELVAGLILDAMADAGVDKSDIGSLIFANPRIYTRQKYFSTFMANYLRLPVSGTVTQIEVDGMTGGATFDEGVKDIELGRAKVALIVGVNFETATPSAEHANNSMLHTGDINFHTPFGFTPISWYGMDGVRYMHQYGATRAELATVAVKNRYHASMNPIAQYRTPITLEEVLAQRPIIEPFGLMEVPPRGDGAICLVMAEEDVAKSLRKPYARLRGRGFHHEGSHQISDVPHDMMEFAAAREASRIAFAQAGITASDLDFAELYAPCTVVEVLASEAIGLVPRGQGAKAAAAGETTLGGRIPICTSGGHQSRGHPPTCTPLYGMHEVCEQLRGRAGERQVKGAELGLLSAELGNYNAAMIHVMEAAQ